MSVEQKTDYRALLKEAFVELKNLQAQVDQTERLRKEPIAVVGMGCRFPGGAANPRCLLGITAERRGCDRRSSAGPLGCGCLVRSRSERGWPHVHTMGRLPQ